MPQFLDGEHDSVETAEAVGVLLADAFLARVNRFPAVERKQLLIACHHRLLQADAATARLLFEGESLEPAAGPPLPDVLTPPVLL